MATKLHLIQIVAALQTVPRYRMGIYQWRILAGYQLVSGADLRGKARHWSSKYARSRGNLYRALRLAGYVAEIDSSGRINRLVITRPEDGAIYIA